MAAAMALAFVVALRAMPSGRAQQAEEAAGAAPGEAPSSLPDPARPGPGPEATPA
jgi:hypothetical protein